MRLSPTLFTVVLLLFLGGIRVAPGDDQPTPSDLGKIQPPGGVPLPLVKPGTTAIGVAGSIAPRYSISRLAGRPKCQA